MSEVSDTKSVSIVPLTTDAQNWKLLQELYHRMETIPAEDWAQVLDEANPEPVVRERVLSLLAASARAGSSDDPVQESAGAVDPAAYVGASVGPYAILRHLGSGGIGSVYLSERVVGGAVQQCALKVLSIPAVSPSFQARFEREQQILATLNHANITHLLDAGISQTGQPYLVMDFVDGTDLTKFCDERHLSIRERLSVFLQICDAVAYAHRSLVVHLDLKPSNVLVTKEGAVKLLDFGTSRLIEAGSTMTTTLLATPAYASPEQLRGESITTSSDVYSLGVMLHELLAGMRPFGSTSIAMAIGRAVREEEPAKLTTKVTDAAAAARGSSTERLRKMLAGDLAAITARCLRSRPQDRYGSVDALAEDLRRYLAGEPVMARKQTYAYRLAKFMRRNRVAIAVAAVVAILLASAGVFSYLRQQQALREGRRAEEMQAFISELFKLASRSATGKPEATVAELLRLGAQVIPDLIKNPADRRASELRLAESMYDDGDYQDAKNLLARVMNEAKGAGDVPVLAEAEGYAGYVAYKLDDLPESKRLAEDALRLAHSAGVSPAARVQIETFYNIPRYELGTITDQDVAIERAAVEEAKRGDVPESELAFASLNLAEGLGKRGDLREEAALAEQALAIYKREPYAVCDVAGTALIIGYLRQQFDDLQGSVDMLRTSYEGYRKCQGDDGRDTLETAGYLGLAMVPAKQTKQAIPLLEDTVSRLAKVAGPDNLVLKVPLLALARSYLAEGQPQKAEKTAERLVDLVKGKVNPLTDQMGAYQSIWARALMAQGKYREALEHARLASAGYAGADSNLPAVQSNAAKTRQLVKDLEEKVAGGGK